MQKFLPIFPLSMVAFPGETIHLHIFEPKYRQLIAECVEQNKSFGIPVVNKSEILDFGTEMHVVELVKKYAGGEMDITVLGIKAFRILDIIKEIPDKLYSGAVVSEIENVVDFHSKTNTELEHLIIELFQLLEIQDKLNRVGRKPDSFQLAHYVGFSLIEEFELLKHQRESVRQKIILEHVRKILPAVRQVAAIRERAKLNGQFRMINPPDFL
ncbi:MAG: LON peptidase substrate-binding domain-containing protein [Chitinophagales bacterium]